MSLALPVTGSSHVIVMSHFIPFRMGDTRDSAEGSLGHGLIWGEGCFEVCAKDSKLWADEEVWSSLGLKLCIWDSASVVCCTRA
jgi:hypothetical protein